MALAQHQSRPAGRGATAAVPPSPLAFLTSRLLDRERGGAHPATDPAGQIVLSGWKQLTDQSSTVLALAAHGRDEDLTVALTGLRNMHDRYGNPGFVEITDGCWRAHPAGRVRTLRYQLQAGAALLTAADRLDLDGLRAQAVDLLNRCLSTGPAGQLPTQLAEDWRTTLDKTETPLTSVAAIRALAAARAAGEPDVDDASLRPIADSLRRLVEDAAWPRPPAELTRCGSAARIALALAEAGRLLGEPDYVKAGDSLLMAAAAYFYDADNGGFWDRLAPDGTARADWVGSLHRHRSPFPIKRTVDAAHLLLAARLLASCGFAAEQVIERALTAIAEVTDHRHGGVPFGVGYQWATPDDPVTVTFQHSWLRLWQPGLPAHEGRALLALHKKTAYAQAEVARAVTGAMPDGPAGHPPDATAGHPPQLAAGHPYLAAGPVTIPSSSPRRGGGPRRAAVRPSTALLAGQRPLRLGPGLHWSYAAQPADTAHPQPVSLIYRRVAGLRLLGREHAGIERLTTRLAERQNADGGFSELPGHVSSVETSYAAILALRLAGRRLRRPRAAAAYLRSGQNRDGGFAPLPGLASDAWHTNLAVAALAALGEQAAALAPAADFTLSCVAAGGGFGNRPGRPANAFATRRAVSTLLLAQAPIPDPDDATALLRSWQLPAGGFSHRTGRAESPAGTHHCLAALAMLGARPAAAGACERWLVTQCTAAGVFDFHGPAATEDDEGFACLQSLAVLRGCASREWAALVG